LLEDFWEIYGIGDGDDGQFTVLGLGPIKQVVEDVLVAGFEVIDLVDEDHSAYGGSYFLMPVSNMSYSDT
jgi:hypothetical protein